MRGQDLLTFIVYDITDDMIRLRIADVCIAEAWFSVWDTPQTEVEGQGGNEDWSRGERANAASVEERGCRKIGTVC